MTPSARGAELGGSRLCLTTGIRTDAVPGPEQGLKLSDGLNLCP